jgi:hypothetical protein
LQRNELWIEAYSVPSLLSFLGGESPAYLEELFLSVGTFFASLDPLERAQCDRDLLCLRDFYERCCRRNAELLKAEGASAYWMDQELLDDWIVKTRFAAKGVENAV